MILFKFPGLPGCAEGGGGGDARRLGFTVLDDGLLADVGGNIIA